MHLACGALTSLLGIHEVPSIENLNMDTPEYNNAQKDLSKLTPALDHGKITDMGTDINSTSMSNVETLLVDREKS